MIKIERKKIKYYSDKVGARCQILNKTKGEIFNRMNDTVELADDLTFGDFFKFLIAEKDAMNTIFGASLFGIPFELFIEDFKRKPKIIQPDFIHYLEVNWYADYVETVLQLTPDFQGIGDWKNPDIDKKIGAIALDFIPLCDLAPYKLKLNESVEIYSEILDDNNNYPIIFKATKHFTFYELIQGIFFALTWDGSPEMRDQKIAQLSDNKKNRRVKSGNSLTENY